MRNNNNNNNNNKQNNKKNHTINICTGLLTLAGGEEAVSSLEELY